MRNKALTLALGALACIFLAVTPLAADETADAAGGGFLSGLYHQLLEWIGATAGIEEALPSDTHPANPWVPMSGSSSAPGSSEASPYIPPGGYSVLSGNPSGPDNPEAYPYIPPGG